MVLFAGHDRPSSGHQQDDVSFGLSSSVFKNEYDSLGAPSSSLVTRDAPRSRGVGGSSVSNMGSRSRVDTGGRMSRSVMSGGGASRVSNPDANLSRQIASEYASLEAPTMQPVAEHIRISKKHYEIAKSTNMPQSHRNANQQVVLEKPLQGNVMSQSELGNQTIAAMSSISSPMDLNVQRNLNAPLANATSFFLPPDEPAGRVVVSVIVLS